MFQEFYILKIIMVCFFFTLVSSKSTFEGAIDFNIPNIFSGGKSRGPRLGGRACFRRQPDFRTERMAREESPW